MGWKASTLGLLGTAKGIVGEDKTSSKLVLGLSLLVLAALTILALVSGVETSPSPTKVAGAETGSDRWTAVGRAYSENAASSVTAPSTLYVKDAGFIPDDVDRRWRVVADYFGKDVGFVLDEVNPRWSVVADYFGGEGRFIPDDVDPRWRVVADNFGKDVGFVLDEVNPRWSVVADYFGGEYVTRGVYDARQSGRDERVRSGIELAPRGLTSARFGPQLRRGAGGRTADAVVITDMGEDPAHSNE